MTDLISGLSESCDTVLAQWELYARPNSDGISAEVKDKRHLLRVFEAADFDADAARRWKEGGVHGF